MGQVNEVTPDGSSIYSQSGTYNWTDPSSGKTYQLPQYTRTTSLSPEAQQIRDATNRADISLANLGADQAERAGGLLSTPFDIGSLPDMADRSGMGPAQYGDSLSAPQYSTNPTALPSLQDYNGSAGLATGYENDFGAQKKEVVDALMGGINEGRDRDMERLRSQLTSQGINIGTEQYSRAVDDYNRSTDAARTQALLAGGQEQSRLVNLARDEATFGNSARQTEFSNQAGATAANNQNRTALFGMGEDVRRYGDAMEGQKFSDQQQIQGREDAIADSRFTQGQVLVEGQDRQRSQAMQEAFASRNQPINEITALLSGSQVQTPQFGLATPAQMPTTDVAGITQQGYANKLAVWQQQQQQQQALMGGLFGLGSSYLMGGA